MVRKTQVLHTKVSIILLSALALVGCASQKKVPAEDFFVPDESAIKELMSVTIEARDEMRLLAKSQEAIAQKAMTKEEHEQRFYSATIIPQGFEERVTFRYIGGVAKAVEAMAVMAGYDFSISSTGARPPMDPWVRINLNNQPLSEGLKEVGLQTGDSVRIEIYPRVIRLIYKD